MNTPAIIMLDGNAFQQTEVDDNRWDIHRLNGDGTRHCLTESIDGPTRPLKKNALRSFLSPRKQALAALMTANKIWAGPDYTYSGIYEVLYSADDCPRWVAVNSDETYTFLTAAGTLGEALGVLESFAGDEYGGLADGVYDLDNKVMLPVRTTLTLHDTPDPSALLTRALPMLERLGDFIGNGPVDPERDGSLGERCDLVLDIRLALGEAAR